MRYLKYFLFILIFFLVPNVYAQEFNVSSSDITCPLTSGTGKYCGAEVYYTGTSAAYNLGTRYDGRLNRIWFNLIAGGYADTEGFEKGHTYTVSMNMATNDWNNKFGSLSVKCEGSSGQELKKGGITYVSYKKIKFTFQAPSDTFCQFVYVDIRASSGNTITQISNWNLSSLTISDSSYDGGSSGGSSGGTPTSDPNQSIIDANNQNTTQIIDNANQNTNDIISSIQETTSQVSDTITNVFTDKCPNLFDKSTIVSGDIIGNDPTIRLSSRQILYLEAGTYTFSTDEISPFRYTIQIQNIGEPPLSSYPTYIYNSGWKLGNVSTTFNLSSNGYFLLALSKENNATLTINDISNFNYQLVKGSNSLSFCPYGSIEQNKIDELNDKLDGLGRVIEDSQVDDKSSFFTGFQDNSHGLTGIITAPLTTIQGLANKSCVPLSIPIPFTNSSVDLPCMTQVYQTYVPTVFNLWQIVSFGIISYFICIDIFKMVKGFKDPNEDKVEVLDL